MMSQIYNISFEIQNWFMTKLRIKGKNMRLQEGTKDMQTSRKAVTAGLLSREETEHCETELNEKSFIELPKMRVLDNYFQIFLLSS